MTVFGGQQSVNFTPGFEESFWLAMTFKKNLLLVVLVWVLLGATNALAGSHDHGTHQQSQNSDIAGPFDGKKEAGSLHCLLKGHTDRVLCPHSNAGGSLATSIATDCGGKTSGAIPNGKSFSSEFAEINLFALVHNSTNEKLTLTFLLACHRFAESLDPPPIIA